jgi:hypothetical protein
MYKCETVLPIKIYYYKIVEASMLQYSVTICAINLYKAGAVMAWENMHTV